MAAWVAVVGTVRGGSSRVAGVVVDAIPAANRMTVSEHWTQQACNQLAPVPTTSLIKRVSAVLHLDDQHRSHQNLTGSSLQGGCGNAFAAPEVTCPLLRPARQRGCTDIRAIRIWPHRRVRLSCRFDVKLPVLECTGGSFPLLRQGTCQC
jgi:hypothetical protein